MDALVMINDCGAEAGRKCDGLPVADGWPGTADEVSAFLDQHLEPLVRYAFRKLMDYPEAEDAVQEVLARLFTAKARPPCTNAVAYLYRSVGNACIDRIRRRPRLPVQLGEMEMEIVSTRHTPAEAAIAAEETRRVDAMLKSLPDEQAETIRLRIFEGLRLAQIAEIMGCSLHTVSSRLRYGFSHLRQAIAQERGVDQ